MSKLNNIFSSFESTESSSFDALHFTAPKEPKKKSSNSQTTQKPKEITLNNSDATTTTVSSSNASAEQNQKISAPASKIMASASVRLYRMNPSTQAYDALDNGGMLGCVVMGAGVSYQLLIYNAQRVPQALVAITPQFDYTVQGMYLSFYDSQGQYFSILFDSLDPLVEILRLIIACMVHILSNSPANNEIQSLTRSLPTTVAGEADFDDTTLAVGMNAGLLITAFASQDMSGYPSDGLLPKNVVKQVKEGNDVVKFKLSEGGSGNSMIADMQEALLGKKKGDRFVLGLAPQVVAKSSWFSSTNYPPASWLYLECEVAKIKSIGNNVEQKATPVVQQQAGNDPQQDELTARIARIASQSGGVQLANILNPKSPVPPSYQQKGEQRTNNTNSIANTTTATDFALVSSTPRKSLTIDNNPNQEHTVAVYIAPEQKAEKATVPAVASAAVENPVAAVPANEITSTAVVSAAPRQAVETSPITTITQQSPTNTFMHPTLEATNPNNVNLMGFSGQFHQSIMIVQQSIMQLHTKMDQIGMQVNNCYTLQQQQQQVSVNSFPGMNNQMNSMNHMNHMSSPAFAHQFYPGYPSYPTQYPSFNPYSPHPTPALNGGDFVKVKAEETVANVQHMLKAYEYLATDNQALQQAKNAKDNSLLESEKQEWMSKNVTLQEQLRRMEETFLETKNDLAIWKKEYSDLEASKVVQDFVKTKIIAMKGEEKARAEELRNEIDSLRKELTITREQNVSLTENVKMQKGLCDERNSSLKQLQHDHDTLQTLYEQVKSTNSGSTTETTMRFTGNDVQEILRQVYLLANQQFISQEEVSELGDELVQAMVMKTSRSNLKRLKDVLSHISQDKLGDQ